MLMLVSENIQKKHSHIVWKMEKGNVSSMFAQPRKIFKTLDGHLTKHVISWASFHYILHLAAEGSLVVRESSSVNIS